MAQKKVEFAILKVKESDFALKVLSKKLRIMFEIRTRLCALLNSIFTRKSLLVNVQVTFKFAALRFEIRSSAKLNSRRSQTGDFRLRSLKAWISEYGHNTTKPLKAKNVVVVVVIVVVAVVVGGGGGGGGGAVAVAVAVAVAAAAAAAGVVVVVVVGRHKDKAPVQTTRSSLQDEMTKPPWNMVVHCIWVS